MDFIYFLKVLYRKKWVIGGLSFLAVAAAFFFLVNKKPLYVSTTQYSTGFTSEKVKLADGSTAIELYTVDVKFDNVIETIKSSQVVNKVSYALLLHDLMDPVNAYRTLSLKDKETPVYREVNTDSAKKILAEKLNNNTALRADKMNEALVIEYLKLYGYNYESILSNLSVMRLGRSDYLDISFASENPELSAWVVNSIGNEFLSYYRNLNSMRTGENTESIRSLMEQQQRKVDSLGALLLSERISQGSIDPESRTTSAMETVTELETRLAEQRGKYNEYANRLSYLRSQLQALQSSGTGNNNDEVVRLTNRRNDLVAELSRRGGNDPALQKQIDDLRAEIIQKSGASTSRSKDREKIDKLTREINEQEALLNATQSTIDDFNTRISRYMGLANVNPGSNVKLDVIRTQLEMENEQLKTVKEKFSQVQGLSKDDPTANFIQTKVGLPAAQPESKQTLMKMALAGMSMFLLTSIFFIFLEIFDPAQKTPSMFSRNARIKAGIVLNKVSFGKRTPFTVILEDLKGKKYNAFKNNIRKLRFEVLNSNRKVFLFTSTRRKTGKTTVIESLSAGLLLSKKRVLLIDLNFSNNTLTRTLNAEVMMEDLVTNMKWNVPVKQQKLVTNTAHEGLDIIGCHGGNLTPAEVLYNFDLGKALEALSENYDYIFIEGAALNFYSDSKELIPFVEGVFTVFSAENSITQTDHDSIRFLIAQKEKQQGVILNKVLTENMDA
ncbi:MAG TPA: hypothetical protein PLE75_05310 [Ferruginibacter sp.]|nr:hypothetical protein [Ferruginibacter sp.]HRO06084.1 hypothetical protein [Ferruginibacter sp.]HRO95661.1 hypothetical protein [Ferruginibacter sp.]HRP49330.1 hypothetical protein [Ferruginibacter sp.]